MDYTGVSAAQRTLFAALAKAHGADNHVAAIIARVEMEHWAGALMSARSAQQIAHAIEERCKKL